MTTPRWLSPDEQRSWRAYLAASQLLDAALDAQLRRDAGMPHAYYIVLALLSEAPDRRMRMSELANLSNSSQSRLSHAVARLEERGWVRRERTQEDRRGNVAILTDTGYEVLVATAPGHVEAVRTNMFDLLSPEQVRVLGELSESMLRKLDPTRMDRLLKGI